MPAPDCPHGKREFELFGDTIEELATWEAQGEDPDAGDGGERVLWSAHDGPAVNPYRDVGRNDPCPCGSGKKFKKCCLDKVEAAARAADVDERLPAMTIWTMRLRMSRSLAPIAAYDPMVAPDPDRWLVLDEDEALRLVKAYHRRARIDIPGADMHAIVHARRSRTRLPKAMRRPVRRKLDALIAEGLDRHEAIHAIGSVLMMHLRDIMSGAPADAVAVDAYHAELDKLTVESWRRAFS